MKAALCFLISYDHSLNKEKLWQEWIEPNKDIINIYFHYDDFKKITSPWIQKYTIPPSHIVKTSYYHVVPAYLAIMSFAQQHSRENVWFIMLTESCVPIISPHRFRRLFFENYSKSIINWRKPWWNIDLIKRANLKYIKEEYHLANDPWFLLKREDVSRCLEYKIYNQKLYKIICDGGIANESIFAIILYSYNQLKAAKRAVTHAADWSRMSSATSPHVFKEGSNEDLYFIENFLRENKYTMFLRKVDKNFPNEVLQNFTSRVLMEDENSFKMYYNLTYFDVMYYFFLLIAFISPAVYFFKKIM
jgi:hypothetical protein